MNNKPSPHFPTPNPHNSNPKIAIVADWLTDFGGAERVVLALHEAFPKAPIYTSVFEPSLELKKALGSAEIRASFIQKFPKFLRRLHKWFPVIRTLAFRRLDLSEFDVIISSSSAESKQVRKTRPEQIHICYCHTPIRYYWSHYDEYKKSPGFGRLNWLVKLLIPIFMPAQRKSDYKAAQEVDVFIANSQEVRARIKKYYHKNSMIIHPPVDIGRFEPTRSRGDYWVVVGRQIPYKRIDLAVKACTQLGLPLKVFGNGSEHKKLVEIAGPTIEFFADRSGDASDVELTKALNSARGFIFPSEEDFGIVAVEALASGAPVVAYAKGGSLDIVDQESGALFDKQTADSVIESIQKVQAKEFLPGTLRRKARRFEKSLFINKIRKVVQDSL